MNLRAGHLTAHTTQNCREEYGEHTCDKRRTRTEIHTTFPKFSIEEGFTEEDLLWEADVREPKAHIAERARAILDKIFTDDVDDTSTCSRVKHYLWGKKLIYTVVSITSHSGFINGFLQVLGRESYPLQTGGRFADRLRLARRVLTFKRASGVLPIVVKATNA